MEQKAKHRNDSQNPNAISCHCEDSIAPSSHCEEAKPTKQSKKHIKNYKIDCFADARNDDENLTNNTKAFDTSALESQIDSLVYQLYNLTSEEIKTIES